MSTLFNELDRAAGALSCSAGAASYSAQVAALQQHHHHGLHQSSNGSMSPTSQMPSSLSQSPLSSTSGSGSSPLQQQSSASPTTSPTLSSLATSSSMSATNNSSSNLSPMGAGVNGLVEDQRALQLAFELSMVGLSDAMPGHHHQQPPQHHQQLPPDPSHQAHHQPLSHLQSQQSSLCAAAANYGDLSGMVLSSQQLLQQQQQHAANGIGVLSNGVSSVNLSVLAGAGQQPQPPHNSINAFSSILPPGMDERSKKSQNMTECVPVPSSEHVAEIVGRQGCKIKALRAKTNTYIKTPVRGEEPVFVVTGRKEDVGKAKREILSAAEHFSLIRASRKPTLSGLGGKGSPPGPPTNIPGQVTIQVRVPYRVVGLVVGPKGATIKHIQQQTHTYIVTPSRDKEPIFEVTGMPDNVQSARRQIEAHIALRTGNIAIAAAAASGNAASSAGSMTGLGCLLGDETNSEFLASLYKNGFGSLLGYLEPTLNDPALQQQTSLHQQRPSLEHHQTVAHHHHQQQFAPVLTSSTGGSRSCSSSSSSTSSKSAVRSQPELINIWKSLGDSIDVDEGLGESPNIWTLPVTSALGSRCSPSTSVSPTDSLLGGAGGSTNSSSNGGVNGNSNNTAVSMLAANAVAAAAALCRRECLVCGDKEVTAALVPCGHNMFCMDCATRVCTSGSTGNDGICPVCSQTVIQAIRIIP